MLPGPIAQRSIASALASHAANSTARMTPSPTIVPSDFAFSTSKTCVQSVSSPASRRRLSSYNPTAASGPTSAKPEIMGKISGTTSLPCAARAAISPTAG